MRVSVKGQLENFLGKFRNTYIHFSNMESLGWMNLFSERMYIYIYIYIYIHFSIGSPF